MPATKRFLARANRDYGAKRRRGNNSRLVMYKPESKYANRNINHTAVTTSTLVLTAIAAGSGTSGRDGRKIKIKSLECNFLPGGTVPIRCIIYVPKTASDTLGLASVDAAVENDQFWILKDFYINSNTDTALTGTQMGHRFPMGLTVEFDGDTATDQVKNPIKMYLHNAGNNTQTINGHTKVWYTDV